MHYNSGGCAVLHCLLPPTPIHAGIKRCVFYADVLRAPHWHTYAADLDLYIHNVRVVYTTAEKHRFISSCFKHTVIMLAHISICISSKWEVFFSFFFHSKTNAGATRERMPLV